MKRSSLSTIVKTASEKTLPIEISVPSTASVGKLNNGNKQKSLKINSSSGLLKRCAIEGENMVINPAAKMPRKDRIKTVLKKNDFCFSELSWGKK